jgi:hypothetical protein
MSRPLLQGEAATSLDVQSLGKILRRIEGDPDRPQDEKDEMVEHLKAVLTMLLSPKRARRKKKSAA